MGSQLGAGWGEVEGLSKQLAHTGNGASGSAAAGSEGNNWLPVSFPPVTEMGRPGRGPRLAESQGQRGPPQPVTRDVFIKSKGNVITIWGGRRRHEGAFLGWGRESLAEGQCSPPQTRFPSLPQLDRPTLNLCLQRTIW